MFSLEIVLGIAVLIGVVAGQDLVLRPTGDAFTKAVGQSIVFTCEIITGPLANDSGHDIPIKWVDKDGKEITDKTGSRRYVEEEKRVKKLYFTQIDKSDAGSYSCSAEIIKGAPKHERFVRLELFQDITFANATSPQYLKIFTDALILCQISGNPVPEISWRYQGTRLQFAANGRHQKNDKGIIIKNITQEDNGEYTCRAEVEADGRYDQRKITVEVHIPPTITKALPSKVEGVQDDDMTISCSATGLPSPKYNFYKGGGSVPIQSGDGVQVDHEAGKIHFRPLKQTDEGSYRCNASNDVGVAQSVGIVVVQVKPNIDSFHAHTGREDTTAELTCESSGFPPPTMTFQKAGNHEEYKLGSNDGGNVIVRKPNDNRLILTINKLRPIDSANYTCKSNNSVGSAEKTSKITVEFKPRFAVDQIRAVYGWAGKTVNITCRTLAQPEPMIVWLRNTIVLLKNDTFVIFPLGTISNLQVKVTDRDEEWIYSDYLCRATNTIGTADVLISFRRATVPGVPKSVNATEVSPTVVILKVDPPAENGGVAISSYQVQYESNIQEFAIGNRIKIENLKPDSTYEFSVRAKNEVGAGGEVRTVVKTESIRKPYPIVITSDAQGPSPYEYIIRWENPNTGGKPILEYEFKFQKVKVTYDNGTRKVTPVAGTLIKKTHFDDRLRPTVELTLSDLLDQSYYQLDIKARNQIGWSDLSQEFIFNTSIATAQDQAAKMAAGRVGMGVILAIVLVIFILIIIIVDVSCYFINDCGVTRIICVRVCGRTEPFTKEKAMEEGEREHLKPNQTDKEDDTKDALKEEIKIEDTQEPTAPDPPADDAVKIIEDGQVKAPVESDVQA